MTSIVAEKKTIIGAKVGKEEKERIRDRCAEMKCNTSDYIKGLIDKDIAKAKDNVYRISIEGDMIMLPCRNCGGPVPFNLADMGLKRT